MLVDPNAKADEGYYLALYATRNILIPAEPTRGGIESIAGVEDSARNFAEQMDISITPSDPILASVSEELSKNEVETVKNKLEGTTRTNPSNSPYPNGVYYEYGDKYIVIELQIYD